MIEFESVEKRFGQAKALDGFDLSVPEGAVLGLIGPNGAGKTTSMQVMSTLVDCDGGRVRVAGVDPAEDAGRSRRYWVTCRTSSASDQSADGVRVSRVLRSQPVESLSFPCASGLHLRSCWRWSISTSKAAADVNISVSGDEAAPLPGMLTTPRPAVVDPRRASVGAGPRARVHLRELIAELLRMGKTVVISSHILTELEGICSHMAIVDRGKVVAQGLLDDIRRLLLWSRGG